MTNQKKEIPNVLYKYRDIENFSRIADIILNKRLYAGLYKDMNDPMEGFYNTDTNVKEVIRTIYDEKQKIGICSLSIDKDNPFMWAHYANGFRGVAIGLSVKNRKSLKWIDYDKKLPLINRSKNARETAKKILTHKLSLWEYEKEVRAFESITKDKNTHTFVEVEIKEVVLGYRMSIENKQLIYGLIRAINTNEKSNIEVIEQLCPFNQ